MTFNDRTIIKAKRGLASIHCVRARQIAYLGTARRVSHVGTLLLFNIKVKHHSMYNKTIAMEIG